MGKGTKTKREYIGEREEALKQLEKCGKKSLNKDKEINALNNHIKNLDNEIEILTYREWRVNIKNHNWTWENTNDEDFIARINLIMVHGIFNFESIFNKNKGYNKGYKIIFPGSWFSFTNKKDALMKLNTLKNIGFMDKFLVLEPIR